MTPPAIQRTALQENGRPNPRPIVDRVFFYIENHSGLHGENIPLTLLIVNKIY
jgi:hypothetical protein